MQRMLWGRVAMLVIAAALMNCGNNGGTDTGTGDSGAVTDTGGGADVALDSGPRDVVTPDVPTATDAGACGSGTIGCNPVTLAGCTAGSACILTGANMYTCMPPGVGGYNAPCTSGADCLEGFACLGSLGCQKLCCALGDNELCRTGNGGRPGALCNRGITDATYFGCTAVVRCDWFLQNCMDGGNCRPSDVGGSTSCEAAGTAVQGEQCGPAGMPCARGYFCAQAPGAAFPSCGQMCDPTLTATGDAGTTADGGVSRRCPTGLMCYGVTDLPRTFGVCGM